MARKSVVLALMLLCALGCSNTKPGPSAKTRIAVVLPSGITDVSWSQSMYDALMRLQAESGGPGALEIAYSEKMFNVAEAAAAIRDYANGGYDVVIAGPIMDVARNFPEITFAWGTATDTGASRGLKNVFAYDIASQEGGYLNGVLAGAMTKTGVIGVVGPIEAGDAKQHRRFSARRDGGKAGRQSERHQDRGFWQCHPGRGSRQRALEGGGRRVDRHGAAGGGRHRHGAGEQREVAGHPGRPGKSRAQRGGVQPGLRLAAHAQGHPRPAQKTA